MTSFGIGQNNSRSNYGLALYRNPFSSSNGEAKIPDGKTVCSVGYKIKREFTVNSTSSTRAHFIALVPCFHTSLVITNFEEGSQRQWLNGQTNSLFSHLNINNPLFTTEQNEAEYLRLVSQGLKIQCVCSADKNDGWFEAIRVPFDMMNQFRRNHAINHPSYVSGKLKDLSKYNFQLKPINQHDFTKNRYTKSINAMNTDLALFESLPTIAVDEHATATGFTIEDNEPLSYTQTTGITADLIQITYPPNDPSFDCILIWVHDNTRKDDGSTFLQLTTQQNFEVIYDSGNANKKFETSCTKDVIGLDNSRRYLTNSMLAAERYKT